MDMTKWITNDSDTNAPTEYSAVISGGEDGKKYTVKLRPKTEFIQRIRLSRKEEVMER